MNKPPVAALLAVALAVPAVNHPLAAQSSEGPVAHFAFDGTVAASPGGRPSAPDGPRAHAFVDGLRNRALSMRDGDDPSLLKLSHDLVPLDGDGDFSLRFWIRSDADTDRRFVVLSRKDFPDNSLASQKKPGWAFYVSHGTWAWNVGSGSRRLTYERDNGHRMPVNDGRWHQLAMTYSTQRSEVRLYYDGVNWVTYHVSDAAGFDFGNAHPTTVGWEAPEGATPPDALSTIRSGAEGLQALVDAFDSLGQRPVESDEFLRLIVDPGELFRERAGHAADAAAWAPVAAAEAALMDNPYTIHQALEFLEAAPLARIYTLVDGEVVIREDVAARYARQERLSPPDFDIDEVTLWDRPLTPEEIRDSYQAYFQTAVAPLPERTTTLTAAAWNIWHGGKHFTPERHGWDSRERVARMLEAEAVDVVMMQETYSSGDFIAAELGYYLATTVDRDYLNQGSNISVLSRYPIREVHVEEGSSFNNVGTRIRVSATQDMYVMSNWYGMNRFPAVFDFHRSRFEASDSIPVLFGGDFNAVPHTDGGSSPASVALAGRGFTDAFRSLYPDVVDRPGATHQNGQRIDQLYYRGVGLTNTSTRVISTWDQGFPSDHFMIVARFRLDPSGGYRR